MQQPSGSNLDFVPDTISVQRVNEQLAVVSVIVEHPLSLVESIDDIAYAEEVTPQDHAVLEALVHLWHQHRHMGWNRDELLGLMDDRDNQCEELSHE